MQTLDQSQKKEPVYKDQETWDNFVEGQFLAWMELYGIEKGTIDSGCGFKATVKRTKDGEWDVTTSAKRLR